MLNVFSLVTVYRQSTVDMWLLRGFIATLNEPPFTKYQHAQLVRMQYDGIQMATCLKNLTRDTRYLYSFDFVLFFFVPYVANFSEFPILRLLIGI